MNIFSENQRVSAFGVILVLTGMIPQPVFAGVVETLVRQFGPMGESICINAAALSPGFTEQDCRDAYQAFRSGAGTVDSMIEQTVEQGEDAFKSAVDCVSDPYGCVKDMVDSAGLTAPNIMNMAILSGNVSFNTQGLSPDLGIDITGITIYDVSFPNVSPACAAIVSGWYNSISVAQELFTVNKGGNYSIAVPACGPITYRLKPTNPLFEWTPEKYSITVGNSVAGLTGQTGMQSTGSGSSNLAQPAAGQAMAVEAEAANVEVQAEPEQAGQTQSTQQVHAVPRKSKKR